MRAEMDYCGPRGIPWTTFHTWDQASRDAALLWQKLQNETCSQCGTHPDDWDEDAGGHPRAWVATVHSCKGCAVTDSGQKRLEEKLGPGDRVGLKRQVERRHT